MCRLKLVASVIVTAAALFAVPTDRARAQARPSLIAATSDAAIRAWDTAVDRMVRTGGLHVRHARADALRPGRTHERLDQYYKGVRVYGGDIARQTEGGVTLSIFGTVYDDIDLDVSPAQSPDAARAIVQRLSGVERGASRSPELLILPDDGGGYRLTYRAVAFTADGASEYFIDAHTGAVVRRLSALRRQAAAIGRGLGVLGDDKKLSVSSRAGTFLSEDVLRPPNLATFDMRGDVDRVIDFLNGLTALTLSDLGAKADNVWTDTAVVDAHAYAGYVYDYYFKRFGRRGLDNNNIGIVSLVHPVRRSDIFGASGDIIGIFYLNAFYAGVYEGRGVMVYGEGLPPGLFTQPGTQSWNFLAGALDVVGHELTHGVTDFSSQLIYENESGALNEAFSDIMGASVEFFYQPPGTGLLRADYHLGEDVITPGGVRSMDNPAAFGQPDHYSQRVVLPNDEEHDNGGVHVNSSIGNHAFYLAIEGGTNRTSGVAVQGVGAANREQVEKVFYRGFTQLMPANATYAVARAVTIQAARDLYGAGSAAERAVTQAWTAVGVN